MSIWYTENSLEAIRKMEQGNILEHLGIEIVEVGENFIKGKMPVDKRTHQPQGILHGGASVVLAESLGSVASNLVVDSSKDYAVGLEVNANHLRQVSRGYVHGIAKPIHIGRKSHVWSIEIVNDDGKLVCISRMTMMVVKIPKA
ncbi:MAG: hotdog fold thioesterase [Flavobacteriales bacterium]|nr:hotdog fold thioesterase [Flavobacteriales bacterium]